MQTDAKAVDKELDGYCAKRKEVDLNKRRLEKEIDSLPVDTKYRERKIHDMTLRLDSLYDVIVELEEKIEDAKLRREAISLNFPVFKEGGEVTELLWDKGNTSDHVQVERKI